MPALRRRGNASKSEINVVTDETSAVYRMDCIEGMDAHIAPGSVDLVVADLPYGTTQNTWDSVVDMAQLFAGFDRVCKPSAAVILFAANRFMAQLLAGPWSNHFRYDLVWAKNKPRGAFNANRMPLRTHENILVFYKSPPTYLPDMNLPVVWDFRGVPNGAPAMRSSTGGSYGNAASNAGNRAGSTDRFPGSVLKFPVVNEVQCLHPTQKPVELLSALIRMYSNPGDLVLDPTMGVGSTAVAARAEGRRFVGFEISPEYYTKAVARLNLVI